MLCSLNAGQSSHQLTTTTTSLQISFFGVSLFALLSFFYCFLNLIFQTRNCISTVPGFKSANRTHIIDVPSDQSRQHTFPHNQRSLQQQEDSCLAILSLQLHQLSYQHPYNMPIPDYGALPLAKTFLIVRGLSLVAMVGIVGMTANFVSEIVSTNVSPPQEIIGTLSIVST